VWLHSLKVAQLLRSAACLHTNQSRSYLNHLVPSFAFGLNKCGCWRAIVNSVKSFASFLGGGKYLDEINIGYLPQKYPAWALPIK